ncbi:hypothetical protein GEMRC1_010384 [Eukaryota sp. GEM-RC1]
MECSICCVPFNTSTLLAYIVCSEGHSVCSLCSDRLDLCPFCRSPCLSEKKPNIALNSIVSAARSGSLCTQIPCEQIDVFSPIGRGGSATVFAALWMGMSVAIKTVSLSDKSLQKLQRELSFLVKLNHPAVLRVFGLSFFHNTQTEIGIVMERASTSLPTPSSLTETSLKYAKDLCYAVKFLHSHSIVHGDLKPDNILLVDGHVRIADFGTSRNLEATATRSTVMAFSHKYAAPEQFDNVSTPFIDIYALGVVLYELMSGSEFFGNYSAPALFKVKMSGTIPPFPTSFPLRLKSVITRCFSSEPEQRPKIDEIIEILNNVEAPPVLSQVDHVECEAKLASLKQEMVHTISDLRTEIEKLTKKNSKLTFDLERFQDSNTSFSSKNAELIAQNTTLQTEVSDKLVALELYSSELLSENTALKSELEQFRKPVESIPVTPVQEPSSSKNRLVLPTWMMATPDSIRFCNTTSNALFPFNEGLYRNVLGDQPLRPNFVYNWTFSWEGDDNCAVGVGVISEDHFQPFGRIVEYSHCVTSAATKYGCLQGRTGDWRSGDDAVTVTVDMNKNSIRIKSTSFDRDFIDVSGYLPSGTFWPYFYSFQAQHEMVLDDLASV